MKAVEGDAVADVQAFRFMVAPRKDVRGDEEVADGKTGDGAAVAVVVEDDLAEVLLAASLFGRPGDLGFSGRRAGDPADAAAGDDFRGFSFSFHEQGVETFLTERDEFGGVFVELVPHLAVEVAGSLESIDPAQVQTS